LINLQAPEQFNNEYSYQIDVWAFGVTMCRLFSLKWPYPTTIGVNELIRKVGAGLLRPDPLSVEDVPEPDVLNVMNQCLLFDPLKRPTFLEIVERLGVSLKNCQLKQKLTLYKAKEEQELRSFLDRLNFGSYYEKFADKGVETKDDLILFDLNALVAMGFSKIKARRLLRTIVKEGVPPVPVPG